MEFITWSVEDELDAVANLFLFNRKVDNGDLTEKEIEEFREELKFWV
nr:MAG TPA: YokU-like protein [Bacteriophage sp.]